MLTAAVACTPLLSPQNGTVTCGRPPGGPGLKSTCQFTCDAGFSLSGPERLDCTPSGHWTGPPPVCEGRITSLRFPMAPQVTPQDENHQGLVSIRGKLKDTLSTQHGQLGRKQPPLPPFSSPSPPPTPLLVITAFNISQLHKVSSCHITRLFSTILS